ncbi:uncharacterized protein [Montipora capricornis]|uniref:uncharacterized protein n=1 Tax=Montipora capricornis TaxID=246305 RepID=UPI0035F14444
MKPFGFTTFGKACLLILIIVLLYAVATEIGCKSSISEEKAGKVFSRGETHTGVRYANFKEDKFSYLNITILGYSHVDRTPQCSLACLETPTCFSYNLAAKPDINGKLLCELLPSDKYNNSDKFVSNEFFHHFSIASPCSGWLCKNDGTCLALYEENSYKCICNAGFTGRDCKNDIDECSSENECHVNATCTNTIGSYNCTCKKGYVGDGRNCSEKIEKSVIIGSNATYLVQLSEWLKPVSQSNSFWKLCWRASRDGWASSTFHSLCDGKGPTVTIIKVNQYIFGGHVNISWGSSCSHRYDATAFLFSLRNKPGWAPTKLNQTGRYSSYRDSIYDCHTYGPTFGGGHDIYISNLASSGTSSYSRLGHAYSPPAGHAYDSTFARTFLAGTYHFRPTEVEVFYLTS